MPAKRWDELSAADKADELRREFDAVQANERQNMQERAHRFGEIERRLAALEEELKQMASRLSRLEGQNDRQP